MVFPLRPAAKAAVFNVEISRHTKAKKFRADRSKGNVMLEVVFDIRGLVHFEFIPDSRTVSKGSYVAILRRLRDAVR